MSTSGKASKFWQWVIDLSESLQRFLSEGLRECVAQKLELLINKSS